MTTYNLTKGGVAGIPVHGVNRVSVVSVEFDAGAQNLAQNDIAELINIPANVWVPLVRWAVTKVEGAERNFSIGDGDDAAGWIASTSGNALADGVSGPVALTEGTPNTVTGFSGGKYYSVADTIDLTAVTAGGLTAMKLKLTVVMVDCNP